MSSFDAFPRTKSGFPFKFRYRPTTRLHVTILGLCILLTCSLYLGTDTFEISPTAYRPHPPTSPSTHPLQTESQNRFQPKSKFPTYIFHHTTNTPTFSETTTSHLLSWTTKNIGYNHDLFDTESANRFVKALYADVPEIVNTFLDLKDPILRSDLFRWLALFKEGGVYTDLDVECLQSIQQWLPKDKRKKGLINIIIGIEFDLFSPITQEKTTKNILPNTPQQITLTPSTIQAKPHHPLLSSLILRSLANLHRASVHQNGHVDIWALKMSAEEILKATGSGMMTEVVWEYLEGVTGWEFGWKNVTGLREGLVVGDVLILPVEGFGGEGGGEGALVRHFWEGRWRDSHPDRVEERV